jgi:hypothetical protein
MKTEVELNDKPTSSGWRRTFIIYGATLALFYFFANFETSGDRYDEQTDEYWITTANPTVYSLIGWGTLFVAVTLVIVAIVSFWRGWVRWPVIGLLIGFLAYPYCVLCHIFLDIAPWTTHGTVQTTDGKQYVFLDYSFLQGQTMAIAKVERVGLLRTTYRALVTNNGDSPRSWASLIRPDGCSDEYGQLYLCNDLLIGVRYDNRCFLAYHYRNNVAYGHDNVQSLSPFVCLKPGDEPSLIDVRRTCEHISDSVANGYTGMPGCPDVDVLKAVLENGPDSHKPAAQALLDAYNNLLQ